MVSLRNLLSFSSPRSLRRLRRARRLRHAHDARAGEAIVQELALPIDKRP